MLEDIKKELLDHPDKLQSVLERFNYVNVINHGSYMSMGRDEQSSKKSIVIKLENNPFLFVTDYARNINKDLFSYIIDQRNVEFKDVLNVVKQVLGISDYYSYFNKRGIFGGFYEKIKKKKGFISHTYDESLLDPYPRIGNVKFLRDHISLQAQKFFDLRYDVESQGIVIPVRNQLGQLMGIKERFNYDIEDGDMKYFYSLPCSMSTTLYGYFQNYQYLAGNTVLIGEAEKFVMQAYTYGIHNCVSLGSGSISMKQVQMILELKPSAIVFMHDVGYKSEFIKRNIEMVKNYSRFLDIPIGYWDFFDKDYPDKVSATDMGKKQFEYILENEINYDELEVSEDETL